MSEVFKLRDTPCYNLRHLIHSVYNGTESVMYLGQTLAEIKDKESLNGFKAETKKWKPIKFPYRIGWTFVPNLGFI